MLAKLFVVVIIVFMVKTGGIICSFLKARLGLGSLLLRRLAR
jgi:hypothetical protein